MVLESRRVFAAPTEGSGGPGDPEEKSKERKRVLTPEQIKRIRQSSAEGCVKLIEDHIIEGSELPEGVLIVMLRQGRHFLERKMILDAALKQYQISFTERTLAGFLQGEENLEESQKIIKQLSSELRIQPGEITLCSLLINSTFSPDESQSTVDLFQKQFTSFPLTTRTLNVLLTRHKSIDDPMGTLAHLSKKYQIEPDLSTYKVLLTKVLMTPRANRATLVHAADLIQKLQGLGWSVEGQPNEPSSILLKVAYARYLFISSRPNEAISLLGPLLQSNKHGKSRKVVVSMIMTFLPKDHPVYAAIVESLSAGGKRDLLERAKAGSADFEQIFSDWVSQESGERKVRFGGRQIYGDIERVPVDRTASAVGPKEPRKK